MPPRCGKCRLRLLPFLMESKAMRLGHGFKGWRGSPACTALHIAPVLPTHLEQRIGDLPQ